MKLAVAALQVFACLIAAAAGLIPLFDYSSQYSGVYASSFGDHPAVVTSVEPGSPADQDGFQAHDEILDVNGRPAPIDIFYARLKSLKNGEQARIKVKRGGAETELIAHGPPIGLKAILYADGTVPLSGGICVALILLILATYPLRPAPWWRPVALMVCGLAAGTFFFMALIQFRVFGHATIRTYGTWTGEAAWAIPQHVLGMAAATAAAFFGAVELWMQLRAKAA